MKDELKRRYKSYSNEKLLDILEFSPGFTEEAILIAREEINGRNLTEAELDELRRSIRDKKDLPANEFEKLSQLSEKKISSILQTLKTFFTIEELKKAENIVRLLLIISWTFYLYYFIRYTVPFFLLNADEAGSWDLFTLLFFIAELFTPIMLVFMALKFKSGWYMFLFNSLLLVFSSFLNLFYYYYYFSIYENDDMLSELINVMNPQRPYLQLYFNLLISSGMLWAIRLKQVRDYFGVNRTGIITTVLITIFTIIGAFIVGVM